jgi:KpsF/GutQ family protein
MGWVGVSQIAFNLHKPWIGPFIIFPKKTFGSNVFRCFIAIATDCAVEREACPLNLAPTTSTTAALAMGDALAIVLMENRRFKEADFRARHPAGKLGERLSLTVSQVMLLGGDKTPSVGPQASGAEALKIMDQGDIGTVLITENDRLLGIFTDGDVRRKLLEGVDLANIPVSRVMTPDPLCVSPDDKAAQALTIMESKLITALPIVDSEHRACYHYADTHRRRQFFRRTRRTELSVILLMRAQARHE